LSDASPNNHHDINTNYNQIWEARKKIRYASVQFSSCSSVALHWWHILIQNMVRT
jgi:hypothetical protein